MLPKPKKHSKFPSLKIACNMLQQIMFRPCACCTSFPKLQDPARTAPPAPTTDSGWFCMTR